MIVFLTFKLMKLDLLFHLRTFKMLTKTLLTICLTFLLVIQDYIIYLVKDY